MKARVFIVSSNVITFLTILFLIAPIHKIEAKETWDYVILGGSFISMTHIIRFMK